MCKWNLGPLFCYVFFVYLVICLLVLSFSFLRIKHSKVMMTKVMMEFFQDSVFPLVVHMLTSRSYMHFVKT